MRTCLGTANQARHSDAFVSASLCQSHRCASALTSTYSSERMLDMDSPNQANELEQYSKTYDIYNHIISLQKFMATLSQIYLGITGVIWLAVLGDKYGLSSHEKTAILSLLILFSLWMAWLFLGIVGAVKLRFILLEKIGEKYFEGIKSMGEASYAQAYGGIAIFGKASWGKSRWFWFIFPAVGLVINIWLIARDYCG